MPESRAIIFDLDDTLYPYRMYVRSGLRAVGRQLAQDYGFPARAVVRAARRAMAEGQVGRELQALCDRLAVPADVLPSLVAVMRNHTPLLRLPCESRRVLASLRSTWKVGILTNGTPAIQHRKIAALHIEPLVDTVVVATEVGSGAGKPCPSAFGAILARLGVGADRTIFVGDDVDADMTGASAVGMKTIHVCRHDMLPCDTSVATCSVHVTRFEQVPETANWLLPARSTCHAF